MSDVPTMRWHAGGAAHFQHVNGHYAVSLADGSRIEVQPEVYEQRFQAYLERLGVKPTSWYAIMQRAEQEWQAYSALRERFAQDCQQWLNEPGPGVFVESAPAERAPGTNEA